jgi:GT2 family glycosyltransferase
MGWDGRATSLLVQRSIIRIVTDLRISIIIPTLGRPDHLRRCLDTIDATVRAAHETICVCVADDEPTRAALAGSKVKTIIQPTRGGYVQAANLGLRAARGEFITILNDDCTLLPHSIDNAIRFLEAPAHRDRIGQAAFFHDTPLRRNIHQQIRIEDTDYHVCHARGLCYANFGLARHELYKRLDYLDERYFMYGADPDFSLKVWHEAKLMVAPCPGALVHHAQADDARARADRARQAEDNARLFAKWDMG